MHKVNIHDAKTQFSRLVEEAAAGQEIIIAKAGRAVAKLVPIKPERTVRKKGLLKGRIRIKDEFSEPLPEELLNAFEGKKAP